MRRPMLLGAVLIVILAIVFGALWAGREDEQSEARDSRREQEWRRGGDGLDFRATITTTTGAGFKGALAAVGGKVSDAPSDALQGFVISVTWQGQFIADGKFNFILLDRTRAQPRPFFSADMNWSWSRSYEVLSSHYSWLADTSAERLPPGTTIQPIPVSVAEEKATLAFFSDAREGMVVQNASELELVVFLVDNNGEVRWARKVPMSQ